MVRTYQAGDAAYAAFSHYAPHPCFSSGGYGAFFDCGSAMFEPLQALRQHNDPALVF